MCLAETKTYFNKKIIQPRWKEASQTFFARPQPDIFDEAKRKTASEKLILRQLLVTIAQNDIHRTLNPLSLKSD